MPDATREIYSVPTGQMTLAFNGLVLDTSYSFTVAAFNQSGRGPESTPWMVLVTPTPAPSVTPTPIGGASPTYTPTATITATPTLDRATLTATASSAGTATPRPTITPTATPAVPIFLPTGVATVVPIEITALPTTIPTIVPASGGVVVAIPTAMAGSGLTKAVVTTAPGAPFAAALVVPAPLPGATPMALRLQPSTSLPPNTLLPNGVSVAKVVAIDVFNPQTGEIVHDHPEPLILTIALDPSEIAICQLDPGRIAILHVGANGTVTRLEATVDCAAGTVSAKLRSTSQVAVAVLARRNAVTYRSLLPIAQRLDRFH
jgi:hypothetical protein